MTNTLAVYSVENLDAGLSKVCNGFLLAAQGYKEIRKEIPNLDPLEIPKMFEQVPMPQMEKTYPASSTIAGPYRKKRI